MLISRAADGLAYPAVYPLGLLQYIQLPSDQLFDLTVVISDNHKYCALLEGTRGSRTPKDIDTRFPIEIASTLLLNAHSPPGVMVTFVFKGVE